jgi:hypothetical protein
MTEEQTQTLSLKAAYAFGAAHGFEREVIDIRDMVVEWDYPYVSVLRRGYIVELFEKNGLFDDFKAKHWAFGNTPTGETQRRRFLRIKAQYEEFLAGGQPLSEREPMGPSDLEDALEFALEAHLRDFLARNLERVEPGLRLYESGDRNGIEFPVDGGRIDLLAVDSYRHICGDRTETISRPQ